jgi:hypothetical protein
MARPVILATDDNLQVLRPDSSETALDTPGRLELRDEPLVSFLVDQRSMIVPLPLETATLEGWKIW